MIVHTEYLSEYMEGEFFRIPLTGLSSPKFSVLTHAGHRLASSSVVTAELEVKGMCPLKLAKHML